MREYTDFRLNKAWSCLRPPLKMRTDAQLLLAMRAPPRPELGTPGDTNRKRAPLREWLAVTLLIESARV